MAEVNRKIRPTPSDEYLGNPHKGCCTFQRFNGDALNPGDGWSEEGPLTFPARVHEGVAPGYLPSTVSYCRWFWRAMEPERGKYDFSMIDGALKTAAERGQTLAVRLMAFGWESQPQLPDWYVKQYPTEEASGVAYRAPIHDSPEYLETWGGFVKEFARRYDGKLESIDISYIGPWGEGAGECSEAQCRRFATLWQHAFKKTPRLGLIAGVQMKAAVESGAGWRCDSFGDLSAVGNEQVSRHVSWNHHFDCYPKAVYECGAADTWRTAPVHLESAWVPLGWQKAGWDLDFVLEQGLKFHATYFMPKSCALPEEWMGKLKAFCRKLGYRFVLRQACFKREVKAGGTLTFESWIENIGVAPIYRRYDFALRFRQGDSTYLITLDDVDITKWLPGDAWINTEVRVPGELRRGWVELSAGLIDRNTKKAAVRFAVKERFSDGFVPLEGFELV
ncbi:MAG TPA: DUF4832 domain-containing protein [Planctomycetota bacterium]|nr:DUF4832 domain-containing protein [Planctomycetota bacterium]